MAGVFTFCLIMFTGQSIENQVFLILSNTVNVIAALYLSNC
jgi:hypothetical protein